MLREAPRHFDPGSIAAGQPQPTIDLRPRDLERWGFDPVQVLDAIRAAYQGDVVGQTYQGDRVFDVVVKLATQQGNIAAIGDLPLRAWRRLRPCAGR